MIVKIFVIKKLITINKLINVNFDQRKAFKNYNKIKKIYEECFQIAFKIIKRDKLYKFINGPVSKKNFLDKKYYGITEYIAHEFSSKNNCMLIYNKNLSVSPVTTHLPIKQVTKNIKKKKIIQKILLINNFYKKIFKINPKIAILGLNPHCESIHKFNEDEKIIKPIIKRLNKKYNISGPYSADTTFIKIIEKNLIIGMYHDQVLTPIKTLFEYDAINITLGLPSLNYLTMDQTKK